MIKKIIMAAIIGLLLFTATPTEAIDHYVLTTYRSGVRFDYYVDVDDIQMTPLQMLVPVAECHDNKINRFSLVYKGGNSVVLVKKGQQGKFGKLHDIYHDEDYVAQIYHWCKAHGYDCYNY